MVVRDTFCRSVRQWLDAYLRRDVKITNLATKLARHCVQHVGTACLLHITLQGTCDACEHNTSVRTYVRALVRACVRACVRAPASLRPQSLRTCRFVTIYRSLLFMFAFCVALRGLFVFALRLRVTSVSSV